MQGSSKNSQIFSNLCQAMERQLADHQLLAKAGQYAESYIDSLPGGRVSPSDEAVANLSVFDEAMPQGPGKAEEILAMLDKYGSPAVSAQTGSRYFGFVTGGITPLGLACRWLMDAWDLNACLYVMAPLNGKLEDVCEKWMAELMNFPKDTAMGFVSGSSMAILCGIAAARHALLKRKGWDMNAKGLYGAPKIRVIIGADAHAAVWRAMATLGLGKDNAEVVPVDAQGRMRADKMPKLDDSCLVLVQAGNVSSGAFDPMDEICDLARAAGAWVHVDGAFGLWAEASEELRHLTKGMNKADSWSTDAHKTLNISYDCGLIFCRDRHALLEALHTSASYLIASDKRDSMLYSPEMSRRARAMEVWAVLKYFGKQGVAGLVEQLCSRARLFAEELKKAGFTICNEVVFNQVLVQCESDEKTDAVLAAVQNSGKLWCGGAVWEGKRAMRVSVSNWRTTEEDVRECVKVFASVK